MIKRKLLSQSLAVVLLSVAMAVLVRYGILPQFSNRHPEVRTVRDAPHVKTVDKAREVDTGDIAPDFIVAGEDGTTVQLADYRDQWVVLVFSRAHW